ncbi:hypothetical protein [Psychroflexus halocasei]|uniref:Magnesium citrate secondary transporter n=1 Tax=Psychroflexus halocasei TaxID=908615 RepID=A0A1H4DTH3_9FLAO|nr:hypothetical protein [Psychroflexus halocasei]SEA76085.1 hypothetical protein SAMN05421540_11510 [Psychroflexus halocasei]
MKRIIIFWWLSVTLSISYLILDHFGVEFPVFIRSYFMDLLCMPVICGITFFLLRFFKEDFYLTKWHVISLTIMYAIYFEMIMPPISERYTADVWDIVMYALGSFLFYQVQKIDLKNIAQKKPLR